MPIALHICRILLQHKFLKMDILVRLPYESVLFDKGEVEQG